MAYRKYILDGMLGLLVGDASGVPYEFRRPDELPPMDKIDMVPPAGFLRSYAHVPTGTWSDDGAQALCLYNSLMACRQYHPHDFATRLLQWHETGYMAVDNYVFDVGNQTSVSIGRLKKGFNTGESGMSGERNNGNGSLMRCLPLALLHRGDDASLVVNAHRQSKLTHKHARSQICCALYCLWARREIQRHPHPWADAVSTLRQLYEVNTHFSLELEQHVRPDYPPCGEGSGYVVDALHSARLACEEPGYRKIIQRAISLGNDTDTTASIAGGIAGIRHGIRNIPGEWLARLRGKDLLHLCGLSVSCESPAENWAAQPSPQFPENASHVVEN